MKVGFDYWQVLSHYPDEIGKLISMYMSDGDSVHIISAIGKNRVGTIQSDVNESLRIAGYEAYKPQVHEVVFERPYQSPQKKLEKCLELGIAIFFDDRDDVCSLLNQYGILAMRVTRKDGSTYDLRSERK